MYVIDENFKVLGEIKIDGEITAFSYVDNKFYLRTQDFITNYEYEEVPQYLSGDMSNEPIIVGMNHEPIVDEEHGQPINKIYVSDDGLNWTIDESRQEIPLSNNGRNVLSFEKGLLKYEKSNGVYYTLYDMSVGNNLDNMKKVVFEKQPLHIEYEKTFDKAYKVANDLYVSYQMDNEECFEVSLDGVYWFQIEYPDFEQYENLKQYIHLGKKILFQTSRKLIEYDIEEIKQLIIDKYSEEIPFVQLNNNILSFEVPPVTESDRTLVPMRFLFEQMGADVTWNNDTQTATATLSADSGANAGVQTFGLAREKSVTFGIDDTTAVVNGESEEMDVPARLVDGKTMVPLRFLSESLGCNVEWDEETNTAIVTTD